MADEWVSDLITDVDIGTGRIREVSTIESSASEVSNNTGKTQDYGAAGNAAALSAT